MFNALTKVGSFVEINLAGTRFMYFWHHSILSGFNSSISLSAGVTSGSHSRGEERTTLNLSEQVVNLNSSDDRQMALHRVTGASQVAIARSIILHALAVLSGR